MTFCGGATSFVIAAVMRARAGEIAATRAGAGFVAAAYEECARIATAEGYPPGAMAQRHHAPVIGDAWVQLRPLSAGGYRERTPNRRRAGHRRSRAQR
jgi:hypothetical protein